MTGTRLKETASRLAKIAVAKRANSFIDSASNTLQNAVSGISQNANVSNLLSRFQGLRPEVRNALIGALLGGAGLGGTALATGGAPLTEALTGVLLGGAAGGLGTKAYNNWILGKGFPSASVDPELAKQISAKANPDWLASLMGSAAQGATAGGAAGYGAQALYDTGVAKTQKLRDLAAATVDRSGLDDLAAKAKDAIRNYAPQGIPTTEDALRLESVQEQLSRLAKSVTESELGQWFKGTRPEVAGSYRPDPRSVPSRFSTAVGDFVRPVTDPVSKAWNYIRGSKPTSGVTNVSGANIAERLGVIDKAKLETLIGQRVADKMRALGIDDAHIGNTNWASKTFGTRLNDVWPVRSAIPRGRWVAPAAIGGGLLAAGLPLAFGDE